MSKPKTMSPFDIFLEEVKDICAEQAAEKGYSDGNLSRYENELMHFTNKNFPDHALGEIIYKAIRYKNKKDPKDLIKIAAWAMLQYLEDGHHLGIPLATVKKQLGIK